MADASSGATAAVAGAASRQASGSRSRRRRREEAGDSSAGPSGPAPKRARLESLPLPVPGLPPLQAPPPPPPPQQQQQQQQREQQQQQRRQPQQQQQQQQQPQQQPQLLPQQHPEEQEQEQQQRQQQPGPAQMEVEVQAPCGRAASPAGTSSSGGEEGCSDSESGSGSSDSSGGSDSEGEHSGGSAAGTAVAAGTSVPATGTCELQLCRSLQDVRQLLCGLRSKQLSCLGFALHLAEGARSGMKLPPPPSRAGAPAAARQQLPPAGTLLGVAVSWRSGAAAYIPLHCSDGSLDAAAAAEVGALLDASRGGSLGATCFRATLGLQGQVPTLQRLLHPGAERWQRLPTQLVDVQLAAWLLHPSSGALYSGATTSSPSAVLKKIAGQGSAAARSAHSAWASLTAKLGEGGALLSGAPPDGWLQACRVAAASRVGWELLLPQLRAVPRLMDALLEQEQPLAVVLAAMEQAGIGCDTAYWQRRE